MSIPTFGSFDPDRLLVDAEALAAAGRQRQAPNATPFGEVDGRGLLLALADLLHQARCLFAAANEDLAEKAPSERREELEESEAVPFPEVYSVIDWLLSDDGLAWTEAECARAAAVTGVERGPTSIGARAPLSHTSAGEEKELH